MASLADPGVIADTDDTHESIWVEKTYVNGEPVKWHYMLIHDLIRFLKRGESYSDFE